MREVGGRCDLYVIEKGDGNGDRIEDVLEGRARGGGRRGRSPGERAALSRKLKKHTGYIN